MAIFWVRQSGGGGGGTSYADAWNGSAAVDWTGAGVQAGDTLMICGAWTGTSQLFTVGGSGTQGSEIVIDGSYGADPCVMQVMTSAQGSCIAVGNWQWVTIQDIEFSNGGTPVVGTACYMGGTSDGISFLRCTFTDTHHGIAISPGSAQTPTKKLWVEDCTFHDLTGRGIWIYGRADGAILDNITIKGSEFYACEQRGIEITGGGQTAAQFASYADNVLISNCTFHDNIQFAAIGITCSLDTDATPDNYKNRRVVIEDCTFTDEENSGFQINNTFWDGTEAGRSIVRRCTTDNCSTASSSGSMENIGCDGLLIEGCTFTDGHTTAQYDGMGMWMDLAFSVDDCQQPKNCVYRGNTIVNHTDWGPSTFWDSPTSPQKGAASAMPSCGFRILGGINNQFYGNIIINAACGVAIGTRYDLGHGAPKKYATGNRVHNNTFVNCTHVGVWFDDVQDTSNLVCNNIFYNDSTITQTPNYTVFATEGSAQQTLDSNLFYGYVNADPITIAASQYTTTGATLLTNTITTAPFLLGLNRPAAPSSAYHAGTFMGHYRDFLGRPFHIPPSIGAYEFTSGLMAQGRTPITQARTLRSNW